jgi:hypothetical protein
LLVAELIDNTLAEWLHPAGDEQAQFDNLVGAIDADVLALTLEGRAEFVPRDSQLQIGSEVILVKSSSGAALTLAERGFGGSVKVAHNNGDLVWVDPVFTRIEILHALRAIVGKLYPWGLYRRVVDSTLDFTTSGTLTAPAGTKRIHSILVRSSSAEELYVPLGMRGIDWVEYRQFDPIKFQIKRGVAAEGQDIHLVCIQDFVLPTDENQDLLANCGIPETLQEDLPMAVAGQVLKGREVPRVTMDRIREALAAAGLNPGVTLNIGQAMIREFKNEAVLAERNRQNDSDEPVFEWQRR